jgi:transposase
MERYVGIDLGLRTKHKVTVYDGPNRIGKPFSIETSHDGLEYLLKRATKGYDGPVNFVFEPTSTVWLSLAAYLSAAGHRTYMVKTQKSSDFRKFFSKYAKSDSIDSGVLARIPQIDPRGVNELLVPTAEETTLKRQVKRRERYVSDASKQKLRIQALLLMVNPFLIASLGNDKFGKATVEFLKKYADPEKVVNRGLSRLEQFLNKHSKGQVDKQRAGKVFEACQKTVELYRSLRIEKRLPFDYEAVQEEILEELELMEEIEARAKRVEKQMIAMYKALCPERVLEQLRGVGPIIAANIIATTGNINRFKNGRKFVAYCGLCPRKNQTGNSDKKMKITKAGQSVLKKSLYLAADVARNWDPEFAVYYGRRYAKGDHHDYILVALARKMALRVYALLKRYEAAKQTQQSTSKTVEAKYTLRTPEGIEIEAKEAREIIKKKYAREVVAPQRAKRDCASKKSGTQNKKAKPTQSDKRWPPKDATIGDASAPKQKIAATDVVDNSQIGINEKTGPVLLSEIIAENMKSITSEALQLELKNLLEKSEQNS